MTGTKNLIAFKGKHSVASPVNLQHFGATKSAQVKIGTEKNEPTWLYSALIKKKIHVRS